MAGPGPSHRSRGGDEHATIHGHPHGRHTSGHHRVWLVALGVLVVLLAVTGVSVALERGNDGNSPGAATIPTAGKTTPTSSATVERALSRCRTVWSAQGPVLSTAQASLQQWQVHVGAMNQLVAGKITTAQAEAFWAKTRVGAAGRVQAFRRADQALQRLPYTCSTDGTSPAAAQRATLTACVQGTRARDDTVSAAEQSIATWHSHINDMEMFRMGQLSPAMAQQMWIKHWHRGQRQLDAYRASARRSSNAHC